jgi:hypothetical protein
MCDGRIPVDLEQATTWNSAEVVLAGNEITL